ncbi:TonB-dependent receptor [Rhodohalobacter sp. 614A]|uniref:TonB-dependent receptor n=1 Tax=Rhodohalobacter sp. 614A TaxID=2908649 RepID=UPI001F34CA12|nr:TonB-dependent receptor [Rhodohalobacter sp. 614A]
MRTFFLVIIMMILFTGSAGAQIIRGIVVNKDKEPIEDVHIQVRDLEITTVSNTDGFFEISLNNKAAGSEKITLITSRVGYESAKHTYQLSEIEGETISLEMRPSIYESETVVVTATRTQRDIEEVTIPVTVVPDRQIQSSGSLRLSDILGEQTGLQVVNDHGTGIQVQGFASDYTLIMIDGNPVIGRTAGTLDLTRISVRNVKQIEIVKGPSSALWGSDALAGVINIITENSAAPFSAGLTSRYGENNTLDLSGDVSFNTSQWQNDLFINRNSSGGYSLNPNSISQTVPEFENYTFSYNTDLEISDRLILDASARYFTETQDNLSSISSSDGDQQILDSYASQDDFVAKPTLTYTPVDRLNFDLSWMTSFYKTVTDLTFRESGEVYEYTEFNQYYNKPELQATYRWTEQHHSVLGTGVVLERLDAERYPSQPNFTTQFVFLQHSWIPTQKFEVTGGFRFDSHSEYSSQISPKFSARFNLTDRIQLRGSIGRGFKAPEFRQLFLDFTNPTAGYSVFGSSTVTEGIEQLQSEGNIAQILIPLSNLEEIKAESSWAANFGVDLDVTERIRWRINLFRNNVTDLIETSPIARKTNGQSVFSYFNLHDVYTQGIETEVRWTLNPNFQASVGYQFLDARRLFEEERTVQDEQGEVVTRTFSSYEPMFNRSKHSGNVKLFYDNEAGWGASLRGIFRGQYGLYDSNGNSYVDGGEYEDSYMLWNASASKRLFEKFTLQAGVDNLLDHTDVNTPNLPGRLWYLQASVRF